MGMSEGNSFLEQFAYKQSLKSSGWFEDITYNTTYGFTTTPTKHISAFFTALNSHNSQQLSYNPWQFFHSSTKQA